MKRMKKMIMLLLVLVMVLACGCTSSKEETQADVPAQTDTETETQEEESTQAFKVAYINADLENPAWRATADGFEAEAEEMGMTPYCVTSNGDAATEYQNAQDIIMAGYDAVAIAGVDSDSVNAAVKELNKEGVPCWILHIKPSDDVCEYEGMIDAQNTTGCYDAGMTMAAMYEEKGFTGKAATITISLARSNGAARHEGFKKAMDESGIELPDKYIKEAIDYTREEAYNFTSDLLTANDDISVIYCNYDEALLGCMQAVEDAGMMGKIIVGGFDGSEESLNAVKDGKIDCIAIQPLIRHGRIVADQMYDYLANGVNGETISTDCPVVTMENVEAEWDSFVGDLFEAK